MTQEEAELSPHVATQEEVQCSNLSSVVDRGAPKFRLMSLPTEIRLIIADHALCYESINWTWTNIIEGQRSGKFTVPRTDGSGRCDAFALSLVCKQLARETRNLVYKMNTLEFAGGGRVVPGKRFYQSLPTEDYAKSFSDDFIAWNLLRTRLSASVFASIREVRMRFYAYFYCQGNYDDDDEATFGRLMGIPPWAPHIQFQFYPSWEVPDLTIIAEEYIDDSLDEFVEEGRRLDSLVADVSWGASERNWRFRLGEAEEDAIRDLERRLPPELWQEVISWVDHGI